MFVAGTAVAAVWASGWFLPSWATWETRTLTADLDADGADESITLVDRALAIAEADGTSCHSDAGWLVQDVAVDDIDRDGAPEVVSLVWKRGSYGPSRPFWVERDSLDFSQHVFIHRYADGALQPVWMSSALGFEVSGMDLGTDGVLRLAAPDGTHTDWVWVNWGLTLLEDDAQVPVNAGGKDVPATLSLLAVGDNIAHSGIYERAWSPERHVFDFAPVYTQVKSRVSGYDVAVVNQETILVADPALRSDFPLFATPQSMGDALADAGFDVVLAATNHALDQGETGVSDTLAFWRAQHPEVTLLGLHDSPEDAAAIDYVEANGIRLAMFDYTYGLNGRAPEAGREYEVDTLDALDKLCADVAQADAKADATVCFLHVGEEYAATPTAEQRAVVQQVVDAGADVVVCSHPHVVQPMEAVRAADGHTATVYWSLGNFVSNQMDPATVLGAAADVRFERGLDGAVRVASCTAVPLVCHFDEDGTRAYFLDDYTEELAASHYLNRDGTVFTVESLREQWEKAMP